MFCLDYFPSPIHKDYLDQVEELKIHYRPEDQTLEDFISAHINQSIVIDITHILNLEEYEVKKFNTLVDRYNNIKFLITKEQLPLIQKYNLPFFFNIYVSTIDKLHEIMNYDPTDIYICEELGFHLDEVKALLKERLISLRVIPNICQSSSKETPSLKTFFICPESIDAYEVYVDVFELLTTEDVQEVIYDVYKKRKWFGPVKEIIPSFNGELDTKFLFKSFGIIRTTCKKRCMYKPNTCHICERLEQAGKVLEEHGTYILN